MGESPDSYCCAFAAVAVRSHSWTSQAAKPSPFQRCKGKSQMSNDLGIRDFLNIGKKQEGASVAASAATDSNVPDVPADTPKEKKDDLPF